MPILVVLFLFMFSACQTSKTKQNPKNESVPNLKAQQDEFVEKCESDASNQEFLKVSQQPNCKAAFEAKVGHVPNGDDDKSLPDVSSSSPLPPAVVTIAPKPESKNLELYDACTQVWVDTKMPFRESPSFESKFDRSKMEDAAKYTFKMANNQIVKIDYLDIFNVEKYLKSDNPNIPPSLRGIWWMDGNPAPEILVATHSGTFSQEKNTFAMNYNSEGAYSWLPSNASKGFMWFYYYTGFDMSVEFGSFDAANMKPGDLIRAVGYSNTLSTERLLSYNAFATDKILYHEMPTTYIADGHWKRETGFYNTKRDEYHCYNLRRIVDEHGKKLPVYDYFVKIVRDRIKNESGWYSDVLIYPKLISAGSAAK